MLKASLISKSPLKEESLKLNELVFVGYGAQKKANLTGAVDAVSGKDLENRSLSNVSEMLQGTMPNVQVTFNSGEPGAGGNINVRGFTSINGGSPLVLVDGVPGDINSVNPKDIESIFVLKDAASAAIYGVRAAFGVILVTTKTAKEGKFTVTYNTFFATTNPTTSTNFLTNGYDAAVVVDNAFSRTIGRSYTGYSEEDMAELYARRNDKVEDPSRPWIVTKTVNGREIYNYYGNYDWWHTFMNDHQPSQSHSLNVSGGSEKVHFMISGNYYAKDGIMKINTDKFKSYNLRSKVDAQIFSWLKVYNNTALSSKAYRFKGISGGNDTFNQIVCHALPFYAPVNPDGSNVYMTAKNNYYIGDGYLAALRENTGGENKTYNLSTTSGLTINLWKDILTLNADYTYANTIIDNYVRRNPISYSIEPGVIETVELPVFRLNNRMEQIMTIQPMHTANVFAQYKQTFAEKHTVSATLGMNYEHMNWKRLVGIRDNLTSDTLNDLNLGTTNDQVKGGRHAYSLFGTFLRVNYNYAERYLVEFNGRYDGTSRFRKGKRFGFFPSISAGWRISEKQIDRLCKEILTVKFKLGLFDDPFRYGGKERWDNETCLPEYLEASREVARSSMVLKNENGILPLDADMKIALIGPAADSRSEMTGTWSAFVHPYKTISFLEGLNARFDNVVCERGCEFFDRIEDGVSRAVAAARNSDIVLMTLGLPNTYSGETASMADISLPAVQKELFDAVRFTGKPIVILLITGRPMTISDEADGADGLLVTWHPGTMGGAALADIISGDYNPSGRLTMTFPRCIGQVPIHYAYKNTGRPQVSPDNDARYVSRYIDAPNEPLFAFGEGLSYTEFSYSDLEIVNPDAMLWETVNVRVEVTNEGERDGEEVVQFYLRDMIGSRTRPVRELKGFKKILIGAGESVVAEFGITLELRSFFRADGTWGEESGDFEVFLGHDSKADLKGLFKIR